MSDQAAEERRRLGIIAAVHEIARLRGELARRESRLRQIEADLHAHMRAETDPCHSRGEGWPCHIALAIEPDTSILEFQAQERTDIERSQQHR